MWELDCEESWAPKNWCFWTAVLEKILESHLDCKKIQPVHSKGDQSWVLFGRNDAKVETPVLWSPDAKSWLIGKDSDAGRDWGQEEKWTTEDEMAGWHHWLNGREFEWTLGVGDGQGGLACCDSWGCKESDTTEWLIWSDLILPVINAIHIYCEIIENIQKQKIKIIFSTTTRSCLHFSMGNLKEGIYGKISLGNFGLNALKQVFFHCRTSQHL